MCIITSIATALGVSTAAVWAGVASAAATAISTTLGVVGNVQQAKATQAQYNYQAQVDRRNAQIAQQNADQKRQEGIEEARQQRIRTLQAVGSQQAAMAANGIDISSGTALDIIGDTAATGELDALTTMYNSETEARAFEYQSNNFKNQSNLDILSGQNAYRAGMTNAASAGFGGLSDGISVASKWYSGGTNTGSNSTKLKINNPFKNRMAMNTVA